MISLLDTLTDALKTIPELVAEDGALLRARVEDRAMRLDGELLSALLAEPTLREAFFEDVGGTAVFDKVRFVRTVTMRDFLPDSFTAYGNKIGLTAAGEALARGRDVVLDWPYKDCVLMGGMTREDRGGAERFVNRVVNPDEIIRLEEPKALSGWEKWDADAVAAGAPGEVAAEDMAAPNLLLKGNNLLALHSLKTRYARKVKLIYIDPPYNTGNDGFRYNDRFTHSTWLTFMRNRLEVARELLADDGMILVNADDIEIHYVKILLDEVFRRDSFIANIVWQKRTAPDSRLRLSAVHDHILLYSKAGKKDGLTINLKELTDEQIAEFANPDGDPRGAWTSSGNMSAQGRRKNQMYRIETPGGAVYSPPEGRCWAMTEPAFKKLVAQGRIWFGEDGNNRPRQKTYLAEQDGRVSWTWWSNHDAGHNEEAKKEIIGIFGQAVFDTPKPERLIGKALTIFTNPGDLVLDFFAGSGTTAAVAQKMGRRWIAVEQMDYVRDLTAERLRKVVAGEQGGVSKAVEWSGGGAFLYAEIAGAGQDFVERLDAAGDEDLTALRDELLAAAFLRHDVDADALRAGWDDQAPATRRRALREAVAADHLYVNAGDMDDADHGLSDADRALTRAFYAKGEIGA